MQRETQTTEVQENTNGDADVRQRTVSRSTQVSGVVIAQRVVWFFAGFIVVFLALRTLLLLLAANQGNFFVDLVYAVGGLFAAPFAGIFGSPTYGQSYFDTASLVGMVVYVLLAWGFVKLFTLTRPHEEV